MCKILWILRKFLIENNTDFCSIKFDNIFKLNNFMADVDNNSITFYCYCINGL